MLAPSTTEINPNRDEWIVMFNALHSERIAMFNAYEHSEHIIRRQNDQDDMVEIVLNHSKEQGSSKLLLLALAHHNTPDGADVTLEELVKYSNIKRRGVKTQLKHLRDTGSIEVEVQRGRGRLSGQRSNRYHILVVCPEQFCTDCRGGGM